MHTKGFTLLCRGPVLICLGGLSMRLQAEEPDLPGRIEWAEKFVAAERDKALRDRASMDADRMQKAEFHVSFTEAAKKYFQKGPIQYGTISGMGLNEVFTTSDPAAGVDFGLSYREIGRGKDKKHVLFHEPLHFKYKGREDWKLVCSEKSVDFDKAMAKTRLDRLKNLTRASNPAEAEGYRLAAAQLGQCRSALNDPLRSTRVTLVLNQVVNAVVRARWEYQDRSGPYLFPEWVKPLAIPLDSTLAAGLNAGLATAIKDTMEKSGAKTPYVLISEGDKMDILGLPMRPVQPVELGASGGRPTMKAPFTRFRAGSLVSAVRLSVFSFAPGTDFAVDPQGRWAFYPPCRVTTESQEGAAGAGAENHAEEGEAETAPGVKR